MQNYNKITIDFKNLTFFQVADICKTPDGTFSLFFCIFLQHPKFVFDMVVLSVCSAVGQLFIYHTIDVFGPVVFTIIMTLRQVSCFESVEWGFV